jgi:predicted nucleotidyltransferase
MNETSRQRLTLAKENLKIFRSNGMVAAMVTGSIAKGYGDDNSDIDTLINYSEPVSEKEFDKIVAGARSSGGDLYHGTPKDGFAVYHYIDGIKCDFGIGDYRETEVLISEMIDKPEMDLTKHLMISGFIDGYTLHGNDWVNKWRLKAMEFPKELQILMVNHFKKFHPEWVLEKMAIERVDELFYRESLIEFVGNMIGIMCALNKMYHPGKLKGVEWTVEQMKIKPKDFFSRYTGLLNAEKYTAVKELYLLVRETLDLIDENLPEVSTERSKMLLDMKLRK